MENNIYIYALGGLGEVGKNMYCIESDQSILLIDAGVRFPGSVTPGVDYVIPDFNALRNRQARIAGLVITHGHEDHIGAIPYLVRMLEIPVIYASKLAAALIRLKLTSARVKEKVKIVEYDENSKFTVGSYKVTFFRVTHSIPDAFGVCVDTSQGRVVTTGDFKVDLTPVGPDFQLTKLAQLGAEGIDLLLSDSTNAEIEGYTPSEKNVLSSIEEIISKAPGRVVVSTFSSNVSRIQQVVEVAVNCGRSICILGRSMENTINTCRDFGYIKIPDASVVTEEVAKTLKPEKVCIVCTGSQGEVNAALSKMAHGLHKTMSILPGDTVVLSSSPIPGNGENIENIINDLFKMGANVMTNGILFSLHSSGHPSKQELRLLLKLAKPKYFMPVHGEYRMLMQHAEIAEQIGIPKENTFVCANGDCLELFKHEVKRGPKIPVSEIYIDGYDTTGQSTDAIKERIHMMDEGVVIIKADINRKARTVNEILIESRGFVSLGLDYLLQDVKKKVFGKISSQLMMNASGADIKDSVTTLASTAFFEKLTREPTILVLLNE